MIHFGLCTSNSTWSTLAYVLPPVHDPFWHMQRQIWRTVHTLRGHLRPLRQQYWLGVIALVDGHARALLQPPPRVSSFGPTAGQAILLHVLELGALGALRNGR